MKLFVFQSPCLWMRIGRSLFRKPLRTQPEQKPHVKYQQMRLLLYLRLSARENLELFRKNYEPEIPKLLWSSLRIWHQYLPNLARWILFLCTKHEVLWSLCTNTLQTSTSLWWQWLQRVPHHPWNYKQGGLSNLSWGIDKTRRLYHAPGPTALWVPTLWLLFSWWSSSKDYSVFQYCRALEEDFENWKGHLTSANSRDLHRTSSPQHPIGWWKWRSSTSLWRSWSCPRKRKVHGGQVRKHHRGWSDSPLQESSRSTSTTKLFCAIKGKRKTKGEISYRLVIEAWQWDGFDLLHLWNCILFSLKKPRWSLAGNIPPAPIPWFLFAAEATVRSLCCLVWR